MLYVTLYTVNSLDKRPENYMWQSDKYFNTCAYEDIMLTEFTKSCVEGIDKSKVVSAKVTDSPVLGSISPRELSGGCKTVLCMRYFPEYICDLGRCGDNVMPYVLRAADETDIYICSDECPRFPSDDIRPCIVTNTGERTTTGEELRKLAWRLASEGVI